MSKRVCLALISVLAQACRFGGEQLSATTPDVDASTPVGSFDDDGEDDGSDDDDSVATDRDSGRSMGIMDGARSPMTDGAQPSMTDAGQTADAKAPSTDAQKPAARDASGASCDAPPDLACDPVTSEGCLPFVTQCIVDPSSNEPAAYCVISGIQLDVTCTQDELSSDCPAQYTCITGQCRKYCYCNADCENGAACTEPSGEGSPLFKVCEMTATP